MVARQLGAVITALLLLVSAARAEVFTGKVVGVSDGDTIKVMYQGEAEKIRLQGIDCPELRGQPFGKRAKQLTSKLVFGKVVTVDWKKRDRYGRIIGKVTLPDGRSLEHELLRAGLAWHYVRYSNDETMAALETEARRAKVGLWRDKAPTPPWDWRRAKQR